MPSSSHGGRLPSRPRAPAPRDPGGSHGRAAAPTRRQGLHGFLLRRDAVRRLRVVHRRQPGAHAAARVGRREPRAARGPDQARPRAVRGGPGRAPAARGHGPGASARARAPGPGAARGGAAARWSRPGPTAKDPRLTAAIVDNPLAARTRPLRRSGPPSARSRSSTPRGRLVAASARGGRLWNGEAPWFKAVAAQQGEPEAHVGEPFRPAGSSMALFEIAYPVRDSDGVFIGADARCSSTPRTSTPCSARCASAAPVTPCW